MELHISQEDHHRNQSLLKKLNTTQKKKKKKKKKKRTDAIKVFEENGANDIFRMLKNVMMTRSKLELGVHEAKKKTKLGLYKNRGIRLIRHLGESMIRGPTCS